MFSRSPKDGEGGQINPIHALVNRLLLAVQNSNILFDLEDIPEFQYLKTNLAFYVSCQAEPQASKFILAMQNNTPQIRKYFSRSKERSEITMAINELEEAFRVTLQAMEATQDPTQERGSSTRGDPSV